jgi:hypothetical protein
MPRLQSILIPLSLMWLPAVVLGAAQGGAISGAVVDDKGAPISNALVLYRSVQRWCEVRMGAHTPSQLLAALAQLRASQEHCQRLLSYDGR